MSECCNQFIMEESMDEFEMTENLKGDPGPGVAPGGTTGQILAKASDEDYDTEWIDQPELDAGHVEYDPAETYSDGTVGKELGTINSALSSLSAVTEIIDTASGAIASFPDGAGLPMRSLLANIEPVQDLHGQDAPYPAGGGKNKLDADGLIKEENSIFVKNGTQYTFNHYGSGIANRSTSDASVSLLAGQTVTLSFDYSGNNTIGVSARFGNNETYTDSGAIAFNSGKATATITLTADATVIQLYFGSGSTGVGEYLTLSNIQLEIGSTATSYAPYSNECPITGWTGLSGKIYGGSDLLDGITFLTGYYWSSLGNKAQSDSMQYEEELIPVEPNATYRLTFTSPNVSNKARIQDYDSSGTFISLLLEESPVIGSNSFFFTTSSNASFIHVSMNKNATNLSVVKANTIACTWQTEAGTVYGVTVDVVSGLLTLGRAKLVLDENIPSGTNGFRNITVLTNGVRAEYYPYRAVGRANSVVLSDKFRSGSVSDGTPFIVGTSDTNPRMYITLPLEYDTEEKIRAWFASNPSEFVYYLATPQTYQLTGQQISTLLGSNTVFVDCGSVSVTYQASIKGYIDKVLAS